MFWEFTLLFVTLLLGAAAIVILFERKRRKHDNNKEIQGILNVDCSDPAYEPYLYLELTVPIAEIVDCKRVTFDVNVISDSSQK